MTRYQALRLEVAHSVGGDRRERARSEVLADFLQRGIDSGKLIESDRDLLLDLAHAAEQIDAPGRRGRGGLMTPSVTQLVPSRSSRGRQVADRPLYSRLVAPP